MIDPVILDRRRILILCTTDTQVEPILRARMDDRYGAVHISPSGSRLGWVSMAAARLSVAAQHWRVRGEQRVYHTVCSRIMENQSRLLDFVPRSSSRATRKAKRALVKGVKGTFSRLAIGAAENSSLALAVASVKAELGADEQQEDAPGCEAAENAGAVVLAGALPSKMLRRLRVLQLKREEAVFAWVAMWIMIACIFEDRD